MNMRIKGICADCGNEVDGELYHDEFGLHIVCPVCGAIHDTDDEQSDD